MTKNELIAAIAEETGKTKANVSAILTSLGATVAKTLKKGDDVTLGGIGKLSAAKREAREARNPSTGATIKVPAKTVVKFKVTKDLADAVA
ncbi:HU family DNA-binding protein [Bosea minatitlanensis]